MDSDIEDYAIDTDEVNECFRRGVSLEGTIFLERVEKQAMECEGVGSEKRLIKIFDHLTRKVDKTGPDHISVINEIEKFGLSSDIILKLGHIFIDTQHSSPRSPPRFGHKKGSERYDDDFDDYASDDFEDDEEVASSSSKGKLSSTISHPAPKYIEEEPISRASKSAPSRSHGLTNVDSNESPKFVLQSSKFKGTSFSWIKKGAWRKGEKIGSGSFGDVYQGMTNGGMLFAVKCMNYSQNTKEMNNLISEIELMQSLCHPNIVQYLGASVDEDKGNVNIFQEWVPGGSIAHLLKRFGSFQVGVVKTYTRQILDGLEYLHSNGIVHRDIKGGNILVDDVGHVKLADFGASEKMKMGETQQTTEIKGTPYFMAPEVLSDSRYGRRGDVWAMGCTIVQMLTGDPPWKDLKLQSIIQLHVHLSNFEGIPPINEVEIPPALRSFLELCFTKDRTQRPMVEDLLLHPFVCLSDEELNESMNSGNDDIVQQLNRAVARASINPNETMGDIDQKLAARRRQRQVSSSSSDSAASDLTKDTVELSPPITSPPSANNPFAAKGRSSTAAGPTRHTSGSSKPVPRYHSSSTNSSPVPLSDARGKNRHDPPSPDPTDRKKRTPRGDHDDDDRRRYHPPSHGHRTQREEAKRRGSDSSSGSNDRPRSHNKSSSSSRGTSREESSRRDPIRRGSDSSTNSNHSRNGRDEYESGNSTEITPRVVQEVGSHGQPSSSKNVSNSVRQKALLNNDRRKNSGESRNLKSSSSASHVRPHERDTEVSRPVTTTDRNRSGSSRSSQRRDSSKNPDERVVQRVSSDTYSQVQSYYDEDTGTGYNEMGEEDGSWMCLKPSCKHITKDPDISWCDKCATIRGASGQRGDNVRLSMNR